MQNYHLFTHVMIFSVQSPVMCSCLDIIILELQIQILHGEATSPSLKFLADLSSPHPYWSLMVASQSLKCLSIPRNTKDMSETL